MASRRGDNPLALVVLSLLLEGPMHPYQMSTTMRERRKEASIKLNYGSLYSVISRLEANGLIEATETVRDSGRPQRTVYAITDAGREEFESWLSELLVTPVKEYPRFQAGLTLMPAMHLGRVRDLLIRRDHALSGRIEELSADMAHVLTEVPKVFLLETDYELAMLRAEREWLRGLIDDLDADRVEGLDVWRWFHDPQAPEPEWLRTLPDDRAEGIGLGRWFHGQQAPESGTPSAQDTASTGLQHAKEEPDKGAGS